MKIANLTKEELLDEIAKAISRVEKDAENRYTFIVECQDEDVIMLVKRE